MENGKLTKEEKATLLGMRAVMNVDICDSFHCPPKTCEQCPLSKIADLHFELMSEMAKLTQTD